MTTTGKQNNSPTEAPTSWLGVWHSRGNRHCRTWCRQQIYVRPSSGISKIL